MQGEASVQENTTATEGVGEIAMLTGDLAGRISTHFQARVAEFDLSVPEAKALLTLPPDHSFSMRELAAKLHANPSNVTIVIGRLQARGLITLRGTDDRRVKSVTLSAAGLDLRRRFENRLAADHPAVRGLSASEREALRQLLRRLAQHVSEG